MSGIADVQSRVAQIQSTFTAMWSTTVATTGPSSASGTDFASQLAAAQQDTGASTGTAAATPADFSSALAQISTRSSVGATTTTTGVGAASKDSGGASGPTGAAVVRDARRYLGVPYVWGGTNPKAGLDCSGLVQRVYSDLGVDLPRVSQDQAKAGRPVASLADAKPGDILAFGRSFDHVAIYVGGGRMIAAPEPGERVKEQSVYTTPTAIRRIVPADAVATSGAVSPTSQAGGAPYAAKFSAAESKYGLPSGQLRAVAKTESGFDPHVRSSAGAVGLMQIMPSTARGLGVDPSDPEQAIDGAARLLSRNLKDLGSLPLALAAYNAGVGAVRHYGGIPPYAETQAYVRKVQAAI